MVAAVNNDVSYMSSIKEKTDMSNMDEDCLVDHARTLITKKDTTYNPNVKLNVFVPYVNEKTTRIHKGDFATFWWEKVRRILHGDAVQERAGLIPQRTGMRVARNRHSEPCPGVTASQTSSLSILTG